MTPEQEVNLRLTLSLQLANKTLEEVKEYYKFVKGSDLIPATGFTVLKGDK